MVNFLKSDDYNQLTDLTSEILFLPNQWGRINQMGLFENEGVTNTSITFDREDDTLVLLDSSNRGTRKGSVGKTENVKTLAFPISFFEHEDRVTAADVQGRRRPGSTGEMDQVSVAVAKKLNRIKMQHAITHEFMKMQALKGTVVSPNGQVFADLFASFGFTQKVIDFTLGTASADIDGKIRELIRYTEDSASTGMVAGNIKVMVDDVFFDALISHPKLREAWLAYKPAINPNVLTEDLLKGSVNNASIREFTYMGVSFEEYRASYKKSDGTTEKLIATKTGHAFPMAGTGSEMYKNYLAPADHIDYVGTLGEEMYAWTFPDQKGRWLDIDSQSAILPLVRRPQVLVKLTSSN